MNKPGEDIVVQVKHGDPHSRPWVLLHGTDGRETDLLALVHAVAPQVTTIAPRGTVKTLGGSLTFAVDRTARSTNATYDNAFDLWQTRSKSHSSRIVSMHFLS